MASDIYTRINPLKGLPSKSGANLKFTAVSETVTVWVLIVGIPLIFTY
jgi:hypothetical protein